MQISVKTYNSIKINIMKTKFIYTFVMAIAMMFAATSCTEDEGFEGKASISGKVTYANGAAVGAVVTIKFGTTVATDAFDYTTVADGSGSYSFQGLQKGEYFVDADLVDVNGHAFTTSGYAIEIGAPKSEVTVDISLK
jgi:hypothetical protein